MELIIISLAALFSCNCILFVIQQPNNETQTFLSVPSNLGSISVKENDEGKNKKNQSINLNSNAFTELFNRDSSILDIAPKQGKNSLKNLNSPKVDLSEDRYTKQLQNLSKLQNDLTLSIQDILVHKKSGQSTNTSSEKPTTPSLPANSSIVLTNKASASGSLGSNSPKIQIKNKNQVSALDQKGINKTKKQVISNSELVETQLAKSQLNINQKADNISSLIDSSIKNAITQIKIGQTFGAEPNIPNNTGNNISDQSGSISKPSQLNRPDNNSMRLSADKKTSGNSPANTNVINRNQSNKSPNIEAIKNKITTLNSSSLGNKQEASNKTSSGKNNKNRAAGNEVDSSPNVSANKNVETKAGNINNQKTDITTISNQSINKIAEAVIQKLADEIIQEIRQDIKTKVRDNTISVDDSTKTQQQQQEQRLSLGKQQSLQAQSGRTQQKSGQDQIEQKDQAAQQVIQIQYKQIEQQQDKAQEQPSDQNRFLNDSQKMGKILKKTKKTTKKRRKDGKTYIKTKKVTTVLNGKGEQYSSTQQEQQIILADNQDLPQKAQQQNGEQQNYTIQQQKSDSEEQAIQEQETKVLNDDTIQLTQQTEQPDQKTQQDNSDDAGLQVDSDEKNQQ